jgi:hypothetical protein
VPQPPTTPVKTPRVLVRNVPFAAQKTQTAVVAAAGTLQVQFDLGAAVTDPNQFLNAGATGMQSAIGPYLDAVMVCSQAATIEVDVFVDIGTNALALAVIPIAALTPANISGLRVTGRMVRISLTNNGAVNADVEFGVYVRSA